MLLDMRTWYLRQIVWLLAIVLIRTCLWGSLPTSRHSGVSLRDFWSLVRYWEAYGVEWDRHIPRVGMLGYHRHLGGTSWTTLGRSLIGNGNRHNVECVIITTRQRVVAGLLGLASSIDVDIWVFIHTCSMLGDVVYCILICIVAMTKYHFHICIK